MEDNQKVQLAEMMLQQYGSVAYFNLLYGLSLSRLGMTFENSPTEINHR